MAELKGITDTVELFDAAGEIAVLVYKAQKGAANPGEVGTRVAAYIMAHPETIAKLKSAADGISEVPAEIKDLSLVEILELMSKAGAIAAKAAAAIKEA